MDNKIYSNKTNLNKQVTVLHQTFPLFFCTVTDRLNNKFSGPLYEIHCTDNMYFKTPHEGKVKVSSVCHVKDTGIIIYSFQPRKKRAEKVVFHECVFVMKYGLAVCVCVCLCTPTV